MSFVAFILLLLGVYYFKNRKADYKNKHELYALMTEIDQWAQKEKISVDGTTPPLSVLSKITKIHPEFADFAKDFTQQYELVVYQKPKQPQNVQQRGRDKTSKLVAQWRQLVAKQKKKAG